MHGCSGETQQLFQHALRPFRTGGLLLCTMMLHALLTGMRLLQPDGECADTAACTGLHMRHGLLRREYCRRTCQYCS